MIETRKQKSRPIPAAVLAKITGAVLAAHMAFTGSWTGAALLMFLVLLL